MGSHRAGSTPARASAQVGDRRFARRYRVIDSTRPGNSSGAAPGCPLVGGRATRREHLDERHPHTASPRGDTRSGFGPWNPVWNACALCPGLGRGRWCGVRSRTGPEPDTRAGTSRWWAGADVLSVRTDRPVGDRPMGRRPAADTEHGIPH